MPQRDIEVGVIRRDDDFHGPIANQIDAYLFLPNHTFGLHTFGLTRRWTFLLFYMKTKAHSREGEVSENITMIKQQILI